MKIINRIPFLLALLLAIITIKADHDGHLTAEEID